MRRLTLEEIELITGGGIPHQSGSLPEAPDNETEMNEFVRCIQKLGGKVLNGLIC